ncbi:MAG: hypothetical protein CSYNP_02071 [Syntrophus sp. SKADARSKE-3]|nr:hypothetical protein [Syntrophus sp. SKADARSKE-3]
MPRVKMTTKTRIVLYCLQIYLIFLFAMILLKFFRTF